MKKVYFLTDNFATKFIEKNKENLAMMNEYYRNGNCAILYVLVKYFSKGRDRNGNMIVVMMAVPSTGDAMTVVAKLHEGINTRITEITTIYGRCAAVGCLVTFPALYIAGCQTRLGTLSTAQSRVKALGAGQRDIALKAVDLDMDNLILIVQKAVNDNLPSAIATAESCGLFIHGKGAHGPHVFSVIHGLSGQVLLTAAGTPLRTCHEWRYSLDNGLIWIYIDTTMYAETHVDGLPLKATVMFKHRFIDVHGPHEWENPISITII